MVLENIKLLTKMLIFDIVYTIKYNLYFKKSQKQIQRTQILQPAVWQFFPVYPDEHLHTYPPDWSVHDPCWHGLSLHVVADY